MKKILFLIAFLILFPVKSVNANFNDSETSLDNSFSASSLDFSLSENAQKIIKIKKDGLLDFNYLVTMQKIGGDVDLCNALQVESKRDGIVTTGEQTISGGEDDWEFTVSPSVSNPAFEGKTCIYNFKFQGWQTDSDGSWGFKDEETSANRTYTYVAPPELTVTGSYTKTIEEKITNNWQTAGTVVDEEYDGRSTKRISATSGSLGNMVWENRLMQSFDSGAKTLAFDYDFFTRDTTDNPGFFVRLNGAEVFSLSSSAANPGNEIDGEARNTGWQTFYYDLSDYVTEKINLIIYAGNTTDRSDQSWVYIDNVTTALATAPTHATFDLSGVNNNFCQIDDGVYNPDSCLGPLSSGPHTVNYYSEDLAGNKSVATTTTVITDGTEPGMIEMFPILATNSATLNWVATGDDGEIGRASKYSIRYSKNVNFNNATQVENIPAPKAAGEGEELIITGLDPGTLYYFDIKAADEAPNWGGIATVSATTTAGLSINSGDLVINELMWAGSQFIELRNMTSHPISISGLTLTKFGDALIWTGAPGDSILENGFFVINGVDLNKDNLQIKLLNGSITIDEAWDGTAATEGLQEGSKYYSMERTSVPGDGTNQLSWYTCIDGTADIRSTPGEANRSENEKINKEPEKIIEPVLEIEPIATPAAEIIVEPTPEPTPTPAPEAPAGEATPTPPPADAGATEGQAPE